MNWMYVKALLVKYRRYMVSSRDELEKRLKELLALSEGLGADRTVIADEARVSWYVTEIAKIDSAISWMEATHAKSRKRTEGRPDRRTGGKGGI